VDEGIPAEVQAAQGAVQSAAGPVQSAVAQAQAAGASAQAQAKAEDAAGRLADTSSSPLAGDKAAVAQFWERYYSSFNPLRAEMAAIASMQLPPVHLGRHGVVTGPLGRSGGINGIGTGTVLLPGFPGGVVSGVGGTTGTSTGTTTSTGTGTTIGTGTTGT